MTGIMTLAFAYIAYSFKFREF